MTPPPERSRFLALLAVCLSFAVIVGVYATIAERGTSQAENAIQQAAAVQHPAYQLYFTQVINRQDPTTHHDSTTENALIEAIDTAMVSIDAAVFELNAPDTTTALVRALGRGVGVRLMLDDEHGVGSPDSTSRELQVAGAELRDDGRSALMHHKFFIIDSRVVWTGSTNITRNGFYNNHNNGLLLNAPDIAAAYQVEFDEMFEDGVFNRSDDTRTLATHQFSLDDMLVEVYFAPEDGRLIESRIIELIENAETSIQFMAFSFTLADVGEAMLTQHDNGILVQGVVESVGSLRGQLPILACAGGAVRLDGNPDILHHKVIIIDRQIVITGSFNFSANARDSNNENLLILHNPVLAAAYLEEFESRFAEGFVPSPDDLEC